MTRKKKTCDRYGRIGHTTHRADKTVSLEPVIARAECRMNEKRCLARGRHLPERLQIGVVEHAGSALGLGADHRAVESGFERLFENLGGMLAALHRHGGERHQRRQRLDALDEVLVVEAAPIGALLGRQFVAEAVEPAADQLMVDAVLAHPGAALT